MQAKLIRVHKLIIVLSAFVNLVTELTISPDVISSGWLGWKHQLTVHMQCIVLTLLGLDTRTGIHFTIIINFCLIIKKKQKHLF